MKVNTIRNSVYNRQLRMMLEEELTDAENALRKYDDDTDEDDGTEEFSQEKYNELQSDVTKAFNRCFAAQFPECRNEWFKSVIDRFDYGTKNQISENQYYTFSRYCKYEDSESWITHNSYCRVGLKLVVLHWKNSSRTLEIIDIR